MLSASATTTAPALTMPATAAAATVVAAVPTAPTRPHPHPHRPRRYTVFMMLMIAARVPSYTHKRWHYFMYDFCYYAQICNLVQCLFMPKACWLFKVNYAFAMGPLLVAVILWRNSLVFHDVDKVITVYIHILPSWLWFVVRWLTVDLPEGRLGRLAGLEQCGGFGWGDYINCCLMYILWQILYFLKTEVWDAPILNADPTIQTSLRWLTVDSSKGIHQLVLYLMRKGKFMKPDERFDHKTFKTKLIFMFSQFCYTAVVLLPTPLHYSVFPLSAVYVMGVFGVAIYNGGEYYIEVFSRRYYSQFEGESNLREKVRDPDFDPPVASDDEAADGEVGNGGGNGGGGAHGDATSSTPGSQRKVRSPRAKRSSSANRMMKNRAARANSGGSGSISDSVVNVGGGNDGSVGNWGVGDGSLEGSIEEPPPIVSDGEDEMDELFEGNTMTVVCCVLLQLRPPGAASCLASVLQITPAAAAIISTHCTSDFYDLLMDGGGDVNTSTPPSELIENEVSQGPMTIQIATAPVATFPVIASLPPTAQVVGKIVDRYEQKEKDRGHEAAAGAGDDESKKAR
mmetsp:Transcript_71017/g.199373  ORF Transcript_71017/g.199373 Transcript_71017/m.199373 type:complete len:569 (+) Transcript_71017:849-2555(+)